MLRFSVSHQGTDQSHTCLASSWGLLFSLLSDKDALAGILWINAPSMNCIHFYQGSPKQKGNRGGWGMWCHPVLLLRVLSPIKLGMLNSASGGWRICCSLQAVFIHSCAADRLQHASCVLRCHLLEADRCKWMHGDRREKLADRLGISKK